MFILELIDIQNQITKLIHDNFPAYKIVLEQQKDVAKPTFFITVDKLKTDDYLRYKLKKVAVTITYVNKENNHVENNAINDKLDNLFNISLYVNNKCLPIYNLDFSESDALICTFTTEYFDKNTNVLPEDNHSDKMKILHERNN